MKAGEDKCKECKKRRNLKAEKKDNNMMNEKKKKSTKMIMMTKMQIQWKMFLNKLHGDSKIWKREGIKAWADSCERQCTEVKSSSLR